MGDASKKISFGFSKINKKPLFSKPSIEVKQFITCVEDKSIKLVHEEPQERELIIPMLNGNSLINSIADAVKRNRPPPEEFHKEEEPSVKEPDKAKNHQPNGDAVKPPETLEEMAAREILEDLKKAEEKEEKDDFAVPLTNQPAAQKESTLEDYESVPVEKFGIAMLRGMGWQPDKGIGKNEKIVTTSQPVLRPKGMGLGADKVVKKEQTAAEEVQLPLIKGAFIKVLGGPHKNLYGVVEGFDETAGRVMVRMTLSNSVVNFNEFMIQTVAKKEYDMNSKVLNIKKYDDYKATEVPDKNSESNSVKVKIEKRSPSSDKRSRSQSPREKTKTYKEKYDSYKDRRKDSPTKYSRSETKSRRSHSESSGDERCHKKDHRRSRSPSDFSSRRRSPLSRKRSPSPRQDKKKKKHKKKERDSSDSDTSRRHRSKKSHRDRSSSSEDERHSKKSKKAKKSRRRSSSGSSDREYSKSHKGRRR